MCSGVSSSSAVDLQRFVAHSLGGDIHGISRVHGLPNCERATPHRNVRSIAGDHVDFIRRDTKLVGSDLGEYRLGDSAHRGGTGVDGDATRSAYPKNAGFERATPGALGAVGNANADIEIAPLRLGLARSEAAVPDRLQRHRLTFRAEVRRRNLVPPEAMPYTTPVAAFVCSMNEKGVVYCRGRIGVGPLACALPFDIILADQPGIVG